MRVLIVEDEPAIAASVADELNAAGYLTEIARDGQEAWFRGETEAFDAIVLDLGLPKLDGLSVVQRWRAAGVSTPVLMLTARGAWMERVAGIDAGADDYLPKPFHGEELVARLGAIVRRSGGHLTPSLTAGGVTIDTRRMKVTASGLSIALTPLEFRLLRYLMHHRGRIVPQSELFEHVYQAEQDAGSNALEVLVGRVRKKLGTALIETRRGFGYVIEA
jgi:two-component system, OmpR family, response regulator